MVRANDPILSNFESFCSALLSAFGDLELKKTMMRKIKGLKQTTSAADYRTAFENYAQYLSLGDVALKEYFYDGLNNSIKDTIADILSEFEPTDFHDFKAWCVRIDSRQHDRKIDGKEETRPTFKIRTGFQPNRNNSTYFQAPPKSSFMVRNDGPQPMDLDASSKRRFAPLIPQEKKRRYDNNLCLYCGKDGHRAWECPEKSRLPENEDPSNPSRGTPEIRYQCIHNTQFGKLEGPESLRSTSSDLNYWRKQSLRASPTRTYLISSMAPASS